MIGFYNRSGECLLRGTSWVVKPVSSVNGLEVLQLHEDASEQIFLVAIRIGTVLNLFYVRTEQLGIYWADFRNI